MKAIGTHFGGCGGVVLYVEIHGGMGRKCSGCKDTTQGGKPLVTDAEAVDMGLTPMITGSLSPMEKLVAEHRAEEKTRLAKLNIGRLAFRKATDDLTKEFGPLAYTATQWSSYTSEVELGNVEAAFDRLEELASDVGRQASDLLSAVVDHKAFLGRHAQTVQQIAEMVAESKAKTEEEGS